MEARVAKLVNELAPVTRRDEWWDTEGPYDIIARHLESAMVEMAHAANPQLAAIEKLDASRE
mgnify:CR=1 FL=1